MAFLVPIPFIPSISLVYKFNSFNFFWASSISAEYTIVSTVSTSPSPIAIYDASPFSKAAFVIGPSIPSTTRPDNRWNSRMAFLVSELFMPFISPLYKFNSFNLLWASSIFSIDLENIVVVVVVELVVVEIIVLVVVSICVDVVDVLVSTVSTSSEEQPVNIVKNKIKRINLKFLFTLKL